MHFVLYIHSRARACVCTEEFSLDTYLSDAIIQSCNARRSLLGCSGFYANAKRIWNKMHALENIKWKTPDKIWEGYFCRYSALQRMPKPANSFTFLHSGLRYESKVDPIWRRPTLSLCVHVHQILAGIKCDAILEKIQTFDIGNRKTRARSIIPLRHNWIRSNSTFSIKISDTFPLCNPCSPF